MMNMDAGRFVELFDRLIRKRRALSRSLGSVKQSTFVITCDVNGQLCSPSYKSSDLITSSSASIKSSTSDPLRFSASAFSSSDLSMILIRSATCGSSLAIASKILV